MSRVVVDTSAFSLVVRRADPARLRPAEVVVRDDVFRLARHREVVLLGLVRQELLSGIRGSRRFSEGRTALRAFADEPVAASDHERAAEMFTLCRSAGVQGSLVDFLICAVAERLDVPILATDADFTRYAQHLPIRLHALP